MCRKSFSVIFLTLFALYLFSCILPVAASGKVRVGVFPNGGYQHLSTSSYMGGYCYDYLLEIAKYTNWEYEYIPASQNECLRMLEAGEIDLIGPIPGIPKNFERWNYSAMPCMLTSVNIFVKNDNASLCYEDFESMKGLRIGLLKDNADNETFDQFCKQNQIYMASMEYDDSSSLLSSLENGKIDAILFSNLLQHDTDVKSIAKIAEKPLYFVTSKQSSLMEDFNAAQKKLAHNAPYFESLLQKQYIMKPKLAFTAEEVEYISTAPTLSVVFDPAWPPIESYDPRSQEISGITIDVLQYISKYSGLKFQFIKSASFSEALQKFAENKADLISSIDHDNQFLENYEVKRSDTFLEIPIVVIENKNKPQNTLPILILTKEDANSTQYRKHRTDNTTMLYADTTEECLDAVASGRANLTYANLYTSNFMLQRAKYANLNASLAIHYRDRLHFGISNKANPLLLSILNKSIHNIPQEKLDDISLKNSLKNSNNGHEWPFYQLQTKEFFKTVSAFSTFLLIILSSLAIALYRRNLRLQKLAYIDPLTDMWNFNKFNEETVRFLRYYPNRNYAIVFLDISKFKNINDVFGFEIGDHVLRHTAHVLCEEAAHGTICARYSADQFILMLQYVDEKEILKSLGHLLERLENFQRDLADAYTLSFSCGIAIISPPLSNPTLDISAGIDQAIIAQRTVKGQRGHSYAFYDDSFQKIVIREKEMENSMEDALKSKQFVLHYQPKYALATKKMTGAEALVRWHHPLYGMISPGEFIPMFEKNGFILRFDLYVFAQVCFQMRQWMDDGKNIVPISVNLSCLHTNSPDFAEKVKDIADQYAVPCHLLEFEITEGAFIHHATKLYRMIDRLKIYGFAISMDDFGSAESSLKSLKELPFDILKIDKDFFQRGYSTEREKIIIASVVEMSQKLKIKVVAEGVETEQQAKFLEEIKCDMVQGYLFCKPLPPAEFFKKL